VAALAGDRPLLVVEGAAGAGKTTLLRVTRSFVTEQGHRSNVVTPTLKAAQAATIEVRTRASSAAKLAHAHGFRWDADGTWSRLAVGDTDRRPAASTPVPATGSGSTREICSWSTRRGC
jgi:tRNA A37 threonylcarbamoyladenosine biosynthesis protein TsaE